MAESQEPMPKCECEHCGKLTPIGDIPPDLSGAKPATEDQEVLETVCEHCGRTTTYRGEDIIY